MRVTRFVGLSFLFLILMSQSMSWSARADELTVYAYPAPIRIDWSTPARLANSAVWSSLRTEPELRAIHSIGHMNFHLTCGRSSLLPSGADIETGQTNSDDAAMNDLLLNQGYGLGMLLTDYAGRWETKEDIEADLPFRYRNGTVSYLHFQIQPSTCARVVAYLNEYKARGYDKIYGGLNHSAREGHGAGCTSFTEAVLEIAGLMAPEWRSYWANSVNMPDSLIGGPITGNFVSFWTALFGSASNSWAKPGQPSHVVHFWDPYLAYWWMIYANRGPVALTGMSYTTSNRGEAPGVEIDATHVPTPTESFWIP